MLLEAADKMDQRMFGLDLQLLFDSGLTLLAVFVLFLILSYNLFNPARKILKDRRDRIQNDIAVAQNDKDEALKLKEEYENKLKEVDKEVEQILSHFVQSCWGMLIGLIPCLIGAGIYAWLF